MKFFLQFIFIYIIIKIVFSLINHVGTTATNVLNDEQDNLERFIEHFVINNPKNTYPMQLDEFTTMTSEELVKKGQNLYVRYNYKVNMEKMDLILTPEEINNQMTIEYKKHYCSSNYIQKVEHLHNGLSNVGIIYKVLDKRDKFITEVIVDRTDCN